MGLFSKKPGHSMPPQGDVKPFARTEDDRYPGFAGYRGYGLKKNAMPENRFKFVRPDGRSQP